MSIIIISPLSRGGFLLKNDSYRVDFFGDYHPLVGFLFFLSVIVFSFSTNHPILQIINLLGAIGYLIYLKGGETFKFTLKIMLVTCLIIAIVNPLFNHQGVTIITYLWDGNPLTLESILYGISASIMLLNAVLWFSCYNEVMTSDKFIYLFGRIIPSTSLIFSMVLRFVPNYKLQIKKIEQSQRAIGRGVVGKGFIEKLKNSLKIFSIFLTWALENAIETADSMKARGYGLEGRTAFSIFKISFRDKVALSVLGIIDVLLIYLTFKGKFRIVYYPMIKISIINLISVIGFVLYGVLCFLPIILNIYQEISWRRKIVSYGIE